MRVPGHDVKMYCFTNNLGQMFAKHYSFLLDEYMGHSPFGRQAVMWPQQRLIQEQFRFDFEMLSPTCMHTLALSLSQKK